ncbi:Piso0_005384 [Millerozyma farinosa CBS 7064]|uniref:Piso0_005384 protein n=1 Tax=Pichia sorbitophila (strain ATCC MYA-4447 / BCRC 22081 / CBS 7064 / NBRC 10061 / NRRL Y-12695) TaxID=559304 RepID=G8Y4Y9_PICSO|nr:Piso0_005384 [Millerozyma farinosa CBS 7064]
MSAKAVGNLRSAVKSVFQHKSTGKNVKKVLPKVGSQKKLKKKTKAYRGFTTNYDVQDYSSIKTMEKVLFILHDAEKESLENKSIISSSVGQDIPYFPDSELKDFGKEIIDYQVIRVLNNYNILMDRPHVWNNIEPLYEKYMQSFRKAFMVRNRLEEENTSGSSSNNHGLVFFRRLSSYFLRNEYKFLPNLISEIESIAVTELNLQKIKRVYKFPDFSKKAVGPPAKTHPVVLDQKLDIGRETNLLAFIINDKNIISDTILDYQRKRNLEVSPIGLISSIMDSQELEGVKIFNLLAKKQLHSLHMLDDKALVSLLFNNDSLKCFVTSESRLLSSLSNYSSYVKAVRRSNLTNSDDNMAKRRILEAQFNKFFCIFYRTSAASAEAWVRELLLYYKSTGLEEDIMIEKSLAYFNDFLNEHTT